MIIGSLKIVPFKIFLMVPFGDGNFLLKLYSTILLSSGVIVAHFTPTLFFFIALAASTVTLSSVMFLLVILKSNSKRSKSKKGI